MGGDNAPEEIVAGAFWPSVRVSVDVMVGDETRIRPLLRQQAAGDLEIVHAPGRIAMDASP